MASQRSTGNTVRYEVASENFLEGTRIRAIK
jgi:hypothetical protein